MKKKREKYLWKVAKGYGKIWDFFHYWKNIFHSPFPPPRSGFRKKKKKKCWSDTFLFSLWEKREKTGIFFLSVFACLRMREEERWMIPTSKVALPCLWKTHTQPTTHSLLIDFRPSSDAEILLISLRLSIQIGAKRANTCMQCAHIPTELPFCIPPLVVGHLQCVVAVAVIAIIFFAKEHTNTFPPNIQCHVPPTYTARCS